MKLMRATRLTQGQRGNDFHWTDDDELLYPGMVCDRDRGDPDGGCGCSRALCGILTHKAVTTFVVVEEPSTEAHALAMLAMFGASMEKAGWGAELGEVALNQMLEIAEPFDVGAVVERRGAETFQVREG